MSRLSDTAERKSPWPMRMLVLVLLLLMCSFKLFLGYRGIEQPEVMDQAQIARSFANGQGFETQFYRPLELMDRVNRSVVTKEHFTMENMQDINYAPLNIVSMGAMLRLSGMHDFDKARIERDGTMLFSADWVISLNSCLWFMLAMVLAYMLIARLFDDVVAAATICTLLMSELLLDYSVSGLAQPMMLALLLAALHCLVYAERNREKKEVLAMAIWVVASFVLMALMMLSGWISLWLAIGYCVFCCCYFRPFALYGVIGLFMLGCAAAVSAYHNYTAVGTPLGNAFYGVYSCFGGNADAVMRTTNPSDVRFDSAQAVLRVIGATLEQVKSMYVNCGGIVVVPVFFVALFYAFKRKTVQCVKWAVLSMWFFACIGMALYGSTLPMSDSQMLILFTPVFTAFGFAMLFNLLSRMEMKGIAYTQARGLLILGALFLTAGSLVARFPSEVYRGVLLQEVVTSPLPTALNQDLHELTRETPDELIVTDQPWAVAWYANRPAVWLPTRINDFERLNEKVLSPAGAKMHGVLLTSDVYSPMVPSSYAPSTDAGTGRPGGFTALLQNMGDFAPIACDIPIMTLSPTLIPQQNSPRLISTEFSPRPELEERLKLAENELDKQKKRTPTQDMQTPETVRVIRTLESHIAAIKKEMQLRRLGEIICVGDKSPAQFSQIIPIGSWSAILYRRKM